MCTDSPLNDCVGAALESEDRKWDFVSCVFISSAWCVPGQIRLIVKASGSLSPLSAGAHWRRHAEHQPRWDGGWWRGGGGRFWRRSRRIFGARRGEWPCGDARFPQSWISRFSLHEQGCQPGSVLHGHVTETEPSDWMELSRLPVSWRSKESPAQVWLSRVTPEKLHFYQNIGHDLRDYVVYVQNMLALKQYYWLHFIYSKPETRTESKTLNKKGFFKFCWCQTWWRTLDGDTGKGASWRCMTRQRERQVVERSLSLCRPQQNHVEQTPPGYNS